MAMGSSPDDVTHRRRGSWAKDLAVVGAHHGASFAHFLLPAGLGALLPAPLFGQFGVAAAALALLSLPGLGFQWVLTRELQTADESSPPSRVLLPATLRLLWRLGVVALTVAVALLVLLDSDALWVSLTMLVAMTTIFHQAGLGCLLGQGYRQHYGTCMIAVAVLRTGLALGTVAVLNAADAGGVPWTIDAVLIMLAIAPVPVWVLTLLSICIGKKRPDPRRHAKPTLPKPTLRKPMSNLPNPIPRASLSVMVFEATVLHGAFIALISIDMIYASWHFADQPYVVAQYYLATVLGRAIIHLASPLTAIFAPRLQAAALTGQSTRGGFFKWLILAIAIGIIGFVVVETGTRMFLPDSEYAGAASLVRLYSVIAILWIAAQAALNALIGIDHRGFGKIVLAALAAESIILAWPAVDRPEDLATRLGGVATVLAVSLIARIWFRAQPRAIDSVLSREGRV